jgi:hypothetical protein
LLHLDAWQNWHFCYAYRLCDGARVLECVFAFTFPRRWGKLRPVEWLAL